MTKPEMTLAEMKQRYAQEANDLATPAASHAPYYHQRLDALFQLDLEIHEKQCEARHLTWFGVKL